MKLLLQKVLIADRKSPHKGLIKDILIDNGVIADIQDDISTDNVDQIIAENRLAVSSGWVDVFSHFCDPGFEYRETLETGAKAAVAGGYTEVFVLPNTNPVVSGKAPVEYIVQKSKHLPITIRPLGAVTKNIEGKDLAEMYDMHQSGAIAFSDGIHPVQNAGLMLKALQYVKAFDGVIVQLPIDKSIGTHGLMNEGIVSTRLGLPGIPALAEEMLLKRDIDLVRYTNSKLHITGVSTYKGIELIKAAKDEGLQITCSVAPYHLYFCDEDLQEYDTNLKVNPPLRSRADMLALRQAVASGWIDAIATHHMPHNFDSKICEFEYAKHGMLGLQTAFSTVLTAIPTLDALNIADLFSDRVRNIFGLPATNIATGANAELTLYSVHEKSVFSLSNNASTSKNSPFLDVTLKGRVFGVFTKGSFITNL